jgi:phosphoglycerol transferase MdoB-like AlkP superfamily enzyme
MHANVSATARRKAGRLLKWFPVLVVGGAGVLGVIGLLWLWRGKPPSMAAAYWSLISFAAMVLYLVAESYKTAGFEGKAVVREADLRMTGDGRRRRSGQLPRLTQISLKRSPGSNVRPPVPA